MAKIIGSQDNIHTCDRCHKVFDGWDMYGISKRHYIPGKNHDKCTSDINTKVEKLIELCPNCMSKLETILKGWKIDESSINN